MIEMKMYKYKEELEENYIINKIGSSWCKRRQFINRWYSTGTITSASFGTIANDRLANNTTTVTEHHQFLGASGNIVAGTDWQGSVKTANYTVVAGQGIFANTSGGAWTLTLLNKISWWWSYNCWLWFI